jgi:hypothetical protein
MDESDDLTQQEMLDEVLSADEDNDTGSEGEDNGYSPTLREEMDGDVLTLERFPDGTGAILGVLIYYETYDTQSDDLDTGEWDFREEGMSRSQIVEKLPHDVDLHVGQVRYRCDKMAEIETPLVHISWHKNPQSRTPTAYYSPTKYGMHVGETYELQRDLFGPLDTMEQFSREDLYELLHEFKMLRDQVEEFEERLEDSPY